MRQSPVSYFADMVLCPLLAAGLSTFALAHFAGLAVVEWLLALIAGAALWTLVEYGMHRLIYHRVAAFKRLHEAHHANPQAYVGAPPLVGTGAVFLVSFVPLVPFAPNIANGLAVGMLTGYTIYMCVHYACHFWTPMPGSYLYRVRLRHAVHHYRDDGGNFGVTTSFWDRVFGTCIARAADHSLVT
jgi:sterol desaturase/sphingolipid hydroxylase (fatty acid hydroxylase superfamily)